MNKYFLISLISLIFFSCNNDAPGIIDDNQEENIPVLEKERYYKRLKYIELSEIEKHYANAQTNFSFRFFDSYEKNLEVKGKEKENFIISPFSLYQTLSMLTNGLNDEKFNDLKTILLPHSASLKGLNDYNRHLVDALVEIDNLSDIIISNSIWTNYGVSANEYFSNLIHDNYDAGSSEVDLFTEEGRMKINKWIERKTFGFIPQLLDTSPSTSSIVLSTLTFKSPWYISDRNTTDGCFTDINDNLIQTEFFTHGAPFKMFEDEICTVLSLEYGNRAFRINIILSADDNPRVEITPQEWNKIISKLDYKNLQFLFPNFTVNNNDDIKEVLENMGLLEIFNENSLQNTFSGILNNLNFTHHYANLKVDERGSDGATESLGTWVGWFSPDFTFKADRPFMFILDEVSTGTILFMGRINKL